MSRLWLVYAVGSFDEEGISDNMVIIEKIKCMIHGHDYKYTGKTWEQNPIFECVRCKNRLVMEKPKDPTYYCPKCNHEIPFKLIATRYHQTKMYVCPICDHKYTGVIPTIMDSMTNRITNVMYQEEIKV